MLISIREILSTATALIVLCSSPIISYEEQDNNIQTVKHPMILSDPIPREWIYLTKYSIGDSMIDAEPDTVGILFEKPTELDPLNRKRYLGYCESDTSQEILGRAWLVWFPSRPYQRILFETKDGLFVAFGNRLDRSIKLLSSNPFEGQTWLQSIDSWFRITKIDSQNFGDKKYQVVEICEVMPGISPIITYKWAIGLGLLYWAEPAMIFHPDEGFFRSADKKIIYTLFAVIPQFKP